MEFIQINKCLFPIKFVQQLERHYGIPICHDGQLHRFGVHVLPCQDECIDVLRKCFRGSVVQASALESCQSCLDGLPKPGCDYIGLGAAYQEELMNPPPYLIFFVMALILCFCIFLLIKYRIQLWKRFSGKRNKRTRCDVDLTNYTVNGTMISTHV